MSNSNLSTYLRHNIKTTTNLEQCLSKASAIVRCVHLGEAKQRMLDGPLPRCMFLNPVAGNSEVHVGVVSLPCITCQTDLPAHSRPLGEY
jgi:hypothetical protein